jgi:hypothetical protein
MDLWFEIAVKMSDSAARVVDFQALAACDDDAARLNRPRAVQASRRADFKGISTDTPPLCRRCAGPVSGRAARTAAIARRSKPKRRGSGRSVNQCCAYQVGSITNGVMEVGS